VTYLNRDEIATAHDALVEKYGGASGIHDEKLLESLAEKPREVLAGKDAYPTLFNKAAILCHGLLFGRPFVDGNKRTAFAVCDLMLQMNGWQVRVTPAEACRFFDDALTNNSDWSQISLWLKISSRQIW
jgi:death-on-curing protein